MHLSQHWFSHGLASPRKQARPGSVSGSCFPSRAAKCPESLCPEHHVRGSGAASRPPPRRALPLRRRSYGLMRQTKSLPSPSARPLVSGPPRVAVSPRWEMVLPNVIPQVFPHVLGPLPRLPLGCSCPLPSPQGIGLPHNVERGRRLAMSGQRLQARLRLSRLQSFTNVQARGFARRPGRSHRSVVVNEGRPRLLHPSRARLVTSSRIGHACR